MKLIGLILFLGLLQACDPYGFGFKHNPAFVLNEAFESVLSLDHEAFIAVSGKEALCVYGNAQGVTYLRDRMSIDPDKVEFRPKMVENSNKYTNNPLFVGYWSYYHEKYLVDIQDKQSKRELMSILVECHYGFDGEKSDSYQNLKLKKYKRKECRLIKLVPAQFEPLAIPAECDLLKVTL